MGFSFFNKIAAFFRAPFTKKRRSSEERTYAPDSFVSHFNDMQLNNLTEESHGVLTRSVDQSPSVLSYQMGVMSRERAQSMLAEAGSAQEEFVKTYIDTIKQNQVADGRLFKLSHLNNHEVRLIRRLDGDAALLFKKTDKIQRLLGPYAVKLYHHRHFEDTYISEMQYIKDLRTVSGDLEQIVDPVARAGRLLVLTQKLLKLVEYFQKKHLYWPDMKPGNFYIRPDTDELCVADNKNIFTHKQGYLPRYAFTEAYTAPSIVGKDATRVGSHRNRVGFSEYQDQLHFSFLKTLDELLGLCDKKQAAAKTVENYIREARRSLSIFKAKKLLYPNQVLPRQVLPALPSVRHRPVFKRRNSKTNVHGRLGFFSGKLFDPGVSKDATSFEVKGEDHKGLTLSSLSKRLFRFVSS